MKALHIASFNGNIGDIANHIGFWNIFRKHILEDIEVKRVEIREFYKAWGIRKFDDDFADFANRFDFIVWGGGTFFDVRWDYSETGVTIDLSDRVLNKIHVPMIFNGLGIDMDDSESCQRNIRKFEEFLTKINDRDSCVVSVRNDGSIQLLRKYIQEKSYSNVFQIPDSAFFMKVESYYHPEMPNDRDTIVLNVANDRKLERWESEDIYRKYCIDFANYINEWLEKRPKTQFIFSPHIPQDLTAISDIMSEIKDKFLRRNISVAPCLNGEITPGEYLIDLYRKSDIVIGMRYHANVCPIAVGTPAIGIFTLNKHIDLYRNLGIENRLCDVSHSSFSGNLNEKTIQFLQHRDEIVNENKLLVKKLEKDLLAYLDAIMKILPV